MFKKDYTIRIFSEAAQEMYFLCDFCKFNSWKKCWGIHCKIIKELKQLGFRPKNFGYNDYVCRIPYRPKFKVRDTLKQLEDKYDTLHGDMSAVVLNNKTK